MNKKTIIKFILLATTSFSLIAFLFYFSFLEKDKNIASKSDTQNTLSNLIDTELNEENYELFLINQIEVLLDEDNNNLPLSLYYYSKYYEQISSFKYVDTTNLINKLNSRVINNYEQELSNDFSTALKNEDILDVYMTITILSVIQDLELKPILLNIQESFLQKELSNISDLVESKNEYTNYIRISNYLASVGVKTDIDKEISILLLSINENLANEFIKNINERNKYIELSKNLENSNDDEEYKKSSSNLELIFNITEEIGNIATKIKEHEELLKRFTSN